MKKYQMLEKAMKDYPKGTKFISLFGCEIESSGSFFIDGTGSVAENPSNCNVHESETGNWAEIVSPKIAVKVENEKEFNALMKYYDSLGFSSINAYSKFPENRVKMYGCLLITFEKHYIYPHPNFGTMDHLNPENYQIIPFSDFAKDKGIKLPLIKSEDGVWLYEGDDYACIKNLHDKGYKFCFDGKPLEPSHFVITDSSICKAFSTKQSALKWIEEQKPKDIIISANSAYPIIVRKNPICGDEYIHLDMSKRGDYNGANIHLTITELREAVKAYDSLHELS